MSCAKSSQDNATESPPIILSDFHRELINGYQRDFPIVGHPFAEVAQDLAQPEEKVLETVRELISAGVVGRLGPVLKPGRVGASTLIAMAVPPDDLEKVATEVNAYPEVNHNYEREHNYNLWFVLTAKDRERIDQILRELHRSTGLAPLDLPLVEAYHIDLGFDV